MNWFYVDAGQQAGPVDDAQLEALARSGKVQADTLVWREGMADWQPYRQAKSAASAAAAPASAQAGDAPTETTREAVCVECGRIFSMNDMIRHEQGYVCANCKPVFMQKLKEGAKVGTGGWTYAGFWIRFAAVFLDGLILGAVNFAIGMVAGLSAGQAIGAEPTAALALQLVLILVQLAIGIGYETFMIGKYGATLGKMACKIRVVTADGEPVTYLRAFGRYFGKMLSYFTCSIGFIMAAFDDQKRGLHDHICNTRVIYQN
ncbi:MAG: RDD family protein [Verrucomicrobia bacterium]|nr:RDD family protein [Verrucomicrobiota bacterium]